MIAFNVNDMTCGHCVGAITKAIQAVDPRASVSVDLGTKRVQIGASRADEQAFRSAVRIAGYTPAESAPSKAASARSGCCCGSSH
ncbi:MAG TPA: heavy-metal-associated domain-containing protein [Rhizobacter sp.]|nr:heavy-metal-associated domain-containing protein [Rhizobacter sp.]